MKSLTETVLPTIKSCEGFVSQTPTVPGYEYLTGLRGVIAIQSFLWVFLMVFVPASVKDSQNPGGPTYQVLLRKIMSPIFWNEGLIYSAMIMLSARSICLPFLQTSSVQTLASAIFRRTASLLLPVAVSLAILTIVFSQTSTTYIAAFIASTDNHSITTPYRLSNPVIYFNSLFNLFWTTKSYTSQAASFAFPSNTLWVLSVVYQQSYTIYVTLLILPHTRPAWRLRALPLFILSAFWVQSWAWYSITGLLLADAVHNLSFRAHSARGIPLPLVRARLPSAVLYLAVMAAGVAMTYLWTAWRPQFENYELEGHTGLYYSGGLNEKYDLAQPQARDDNYLILLGFFLLLETSEALRWVFGNRVFVVLGRRCYCFFLTQSILIYTVGIKLFVYLRGQRKASFEVATLVVFFVCVAATGVAAELMYRGVELPGRRCAVLLWKWMRE